MQIHRRVVGIHSRIGVSLATNFHVPISTYRVNWKELTDGKLWKSRAFIGVRGTDSDSAEIGTVREDSPAESAGLRVGDIVTVFDGVRIKDFPQLVQLVRQHQPGETVNMEVIRNSKKVDLQITIGRRRNGAKS
ncbi:MAG: PDZ domain-containing protein [Planctomycetota bacterium]